MSENDKGVADKSKGGKIWKRMSVRLSKALHPAKDGVLTDPLVLDDAHFKRLSVCGRGGYSIVYVAKWRFDERKPLVALKYIDKEPIVKKQNLHKAWRGL